MRWFKKAEKTQKSTVGVSYFVGGAPVVVYDYDREDFVKKGYAGNAEVYSIIKKITDKSSVATPYVYIDKEGVKSHRLATTKSMRDTPEGAARHRMEVSKALTYAPETLDLTKLLVNPSPNQTWRELSALLDIFYFAQGEAFLYRDSGDDNCALEVNIAPAHLMTAIVDGGKLVGWQLDLMNGYYRTWMYEEMKDVMHLKMANPLFDNKFTHFRGLSPLTAGLKYLQLDDSAILSWIKSVENEGAKGLISPNHPNPELWLTPDQVTSTETKVSEKIQGAENKNKIVVSGMPLQYTHIGLSPDALNIIEGLKFAKVNLCDLWGVPADLFNPDPTYANQNEAGKRFIKEVILPYLSAKEDKLNSWLVEPFRKRDKRNYLIDYDISAYEELRLSVDQTDALLKTHTINEVRVMLGSDELSEEYANQVFIAQGQIPLSDYDVNFDGI
jgi:phage portal protein BeeE